MKLFNKTIDKQLFKQYSLGSDLSKQEVVVKIFNPYGRGTWFIINSDPEDPDYLWAIVDLGYGAEVGSVSRSDLENYRNRMGLGFERDLSFDPVNALELLQGVRAGEFYANGGNLSDLSDNQRMIMNQNVEIEHHHEELEDILENEVPVPAWVVAKMETATQNLSDITHYLDGQRELKEEEQEDDDDVMGKDVIEPIVVGGEDRGKVFKNFTNDAWNNFRGFLKGMEGIDLRDDYTFDYKDEQFEIGPIVNANENGVSNAVFTIFDGDGEEVGEVVYSREGGKQRFTADSEFFGWNNTKFENGGGLENDGYNLKDVNGKQIEVGDVVKTTQPSGGLLNPANSETGVVEKAKDAFGQDALRIRYRKEGTNYDRFILLNGKINEIVKKADSFAFGGDVDAVKMNLGEPVMYNDELWYVSEKNGVVGLTNMKQSARGSDYLFVPISKIMVSQQVTDMMGRKVRIPYLVEDFEKGGTLTEDDVKVGDWLQKKDNKAKAKVHDIKKDKLSTEIFVEDLYGNKVQRAITLKHWKKIAEPKRELERFEKVKKEFSGDSGLKEYVLKADIKTVTVKRNGKEVTYKGADVYNGANMLSGGGDLSSKANYIPKRDVVEVELKDGSKVKPVNGYWVKKGAEPIGNEPTPTSSGSSEPKIGITRIEKDSRNNWRAETKIEDFNEYDWRISTVKSYSGKLVSSAQAGKFEQGKGYVTFKYVVYQDPNHTLEVSSPKRLTDKVVSEQHDKALAKFKKFMETGMFKSGGKISNFDKLSAKVAEQYEGKPVKGSYQEEYGKYYSKEEAQEVGDKVAGKVKAMQSEKKAFGGLFGGAKNLIKTKKYPNLDDQVAYTKGGEAVMVVDQSSNTLLVIDANKIGTGVLPRKMNISEIDPTSYKSGGAIKRGKSHSGRNMLKEANDLAKKIRKDGESWQDAKKRAFAQLKN